MGLQDPKVAKYMSVCARGGAFVTSGKIILHLHKLVFVNFLKLAIQNILSCMYHIKLYH